MTTSASCSMEPESRRSDSMGRLSERCMLARDSWAQASSGTFSSRAMALRRREISLTSSWRFSLRPSAVISCR